MTSNPEFKSPIAMKKRVVIELSDSSDDDTFISKKPKLRTKVLDLGLHLSQLRNIEPKFNSNCKSLSALLSVEVQIKQMYIFSFVIDLEYIFGMLPLTHRNVPITVVHGHKKPETQNDADGYTTLYKFAERHPNIKVIDPYTPPWGTHHTKMLVFEASDGHLRLVIHTGNATGDDWDLGNMTQGCWISPRFPKKATGAANESSFETDFLRYLEGYQWRLKSLKALVKTFDFSGTNAVLISSVPGRHRNEQMNWYGHMRLRHVLETLYSSNEPRALVISQCSSVGSLGPNKRWLNDFLTSVKASKEGTAEAQWKLVYPCEEDVLDCLDPMLAMGHLLCNGKAWLKMESELRPHMCKWRADGSGRTGCMPHHKSYMRLCETDVSKIGWYLLTSANMSKAAWGDLQKSNTELNVLSFELGVLFISSDESRLQLQPVSPADYAALDLSVKVDSCTSPPTAVVPVPYDLPLTAYSESDYPWSAISLAKLGLISS